MPTFPVLSILSLSHGFPDAGFVKNLIAEDETSPVEATMSEYLL